MLRTFKLFETAASAVGSVLSRRDKPIVMLLIGPDTESSRLVEIEDNAHAMSEVRKLLGSENIGILPRLDQSNKMLFNEDAQDDESVFHGFHFSFGFGDWSKTYFGKAIIIGEYKGEGTTWSSSTLEDCGLVWETRESHAQYLRDLQEYDERFGSSHPGWADIESLERMAFPELNDSF